ncbi:MAG: glycosyl transferase family 1 [Thaumarchaeota archaeon]|nr:MAG: glycosyl transferase family 1 [Nitrososphaerota archaeon]
MKILISGAKTKFFHLEEFGEALTKLGVEYKLVHDIDIIDGFPSRRIKNWLQNKTKFNKLISEFKPDLVFVDRQIRFGVATIESNIPLYVHLRGDYWSEMQWAKETLYKDPIKKTVLWFKNRTTSKCFSDSTSIIPICNYLKEIVKNKYPEKSVETLYQGIDPSKWFETKGMKLQHPCVGLIQNASIWGKTRELLILPKILEAMPNVMFYWVGDGVYTNKVLPVLEKYDNFTWLGHLEYPNKVREFLDEIDIYALMSGIDMSPLTLQEAQLMKKPVIATRVGGIPELMIENETGYLINKGEHKEWIKKIDILLNDEKKSKEMGKKGREFVEKEFNWNKIAENFLKIVKQNSKI